MAGHDACPRLDPADSTPTLPIDGAALSGDWQQAHAAGFVGADSVLLAFLRQSHALPRLSWGQTPVFAPPRTDAAQPLDLYAITDDAQRLEQAMAAGVRTVQLRIKRVPQPDAAWHAHLRTEVTRGIAAAREVGAQCFVNDHWALAATLGADAVHLGQEDLVALGEGGRQQLLTSGVALGISSHSVWELCRARALSPRYIACGPVWSTTTKDMPWVPQGVGNLAWWCRHAGAPVVAIGGILSPQRAREAAAAGADGIMVEVHPKPEEAACTSTARVCSRPGPRKARCARRGVRLAPSEPAPGLKRDAG